ncbi:MAG TPA: hypothetical protein VLJ37_10405 [bacterium]|nr:hypothetical protein [bacterium]
MASKGSLQGLRRKVLVGPVLLLLLGMAARTEGASLERDLSEADGRLSAFDRALNFQERKTLRQTPARGLERLPGALLKKYEEREALKREFTEARLMVDLKRRLLELPGRDEYASGPHNLLREQEAEAIARMAVPAFAELRREYEMVRPALLHNLLVNIGIRDQGLCWQWARDLMDRLKSLNLETFDVLWATAREGTMREHNTVVVVSKGRDLREGLFLDGWKKAGKPFWMLVREDKKHPWKPGTYYGGRH